MRIYSLSKVLSLPLILAAGYIIYYHFTGYNSEYSILIMIPALLLVVLYIFHGQIDFWWLSRNPIPLDPKIKEWFKKHSPYYTNLTESERIQFEHRLNLYVEGREFKSVGTSELKDVPYDLKMIIASQAIMLTANHTDFLIGDVDRIYVYKHPFPSPQHKFLHTVETHVEDGIILLTSEYALPGISHQDQFYNIALHAFSEAFMEVHPDYDYPTVHQHGWEGIEKVSGLTKEKILKTSGYETLDLLVVHTVCYFDYTDLYKEQFPIEFQAFQSIYNHA